MRTILCLFVITGVITVRAADLSDAEFKKAYDIDWDATCLVFPEAADPKSNLRKEMEIILAELNAGNSEIPSSPQINSKVAKMAVVRIFQRAALDGRVAPPVTPAPAPAAAPVLTNPAALMTLIQQEEAAAGQLKPYRNKVTYGSGKWAGKTKKELIAACVNQFAAAYGYTPIYEDGAPIEG